MVGARTGVRVASGREAGARCPACSTRVEAGGPVAVCARCGAAHHEGCWLSGGCAAFECAPANRREVDSAPVRITFDEVSNAAVLPAPRISRPSHRPAPRVRPRYALMILVGLGMLGGSGASLALAKIVGSSGWLVGSAILAIVAIACCVVGLSLVAQDRRRGLGGGLLGLLAGLALLVLVGIDAGHKLPNPTGPGVKLDGGFDLTRIDEYDPPVRAAMRANAFITGPRGGGMSIGSGVVLRSRNGEALVLTNRHVVDPGFEAWRGGIDDPSTLEVSVALTGQPPEKGRVTWLAPDGLDLAAVAVPLRSNEARPLAYRPGQARAVVGREAFAVGNPLGMGWTHTAGRFSQVRPQKAGDTEYRLIQTSAAVHPGNSGGGLYDSEGKLVGIVTLKIDAAHDGIGFAIELDSVAGLLPPELITPKVP